MKKYVLMCALLFSAWASKAQEKTTTQKQATALQNYSLEQCVEYAIANHLSVKNSELDLQTSIAKVNEIKSIGLPQVEATIGALHYYQVPQSFIPGDFVGKPGIFIPVKFQPKYASQANIALTQLVFDGTYLLGLKAAQVYTKLAENSIVKNKIDIAENVSKAYYGVLIMNERGALIDQNYKRLDSLLIQTKAMYEGGFAEKIDADRIEVAFNNIKIEKEKFERVKELSMLLLKFQMGLATDDQLSISGKLADVQLNTNETATADATQRIEYTMLKVQQELYTMDIKRYKVGYYPSLYFSANYGANTGANEFGDLFKFGDRWFTNGNIGFQLRIPIFDSFKKKNQILQAKYTLQKTENDMLNFERVVAFQVQQYGGMLLNHIATLEAQKKNMELAQEVYRVANLKFKEGVGSSIEVSNAETALKEAQTNYYSALYDAVITKIDLDKARGTLFKQQ